MTIFKKDMEEALMDAGCLYELDSFSATADGGDVMLMWQAAKATANYCYEMRFVEEPILEEARFFVMADYLTYIPYGSVGYAAFEKMLQKLRPGMTVGEYRFERLKELAERPLSRLNAEQLAYIRNYFENYGKQSVDLTNPAETVAFICRFHHELEAHYGEKGYGNLMRLSELSVEFARQISLLSDEDSIPDVGAYLGQVPAHSELGERELQFIRRCTGLSQE